MPRTDWFLSTKEPAVSDIESKLIADWSLLAANLLFVTFRTGQSSVSAVLWKRSACLCCLQDPRAVGNQGAHEQGELFQFCLIQCRSVQQHCIFLHTGLFLFLRVNDFTKRVSVQNSDCGGGFLACEDFFGCGEWGWGVDYSIPASAFFFKLEISSLELRR